MITGTLDGHAADSPDRARTTSEACNHILTAKSDCGKLTGQSGWRSLGLASGCIDCAAAEVQQMGRNRFTGNQTESRFPRRELVACQLLPWLADALRNLNRVEFAGFLAGDINDPRGLALFAGDQQSVAVS